MPQYSPDGRHYWNGYAWLETPAHVLKANRRHHLRRVALITLVMSAFTTLLLALWYWILQTVGLLG
jgi:hypothetical protein